MKIHELNDIKVKFDSNSLGYERYSFWKIG